MAKLLIFLLFILTFLTAVYGNCPSRCRPDDVTSPRRCVRDASGVICMLMTECQVRTINCRLRDRNQPPVITTGLDECGDMAMNCGGLCARELRRKPRAVRPKCSQIKCSNPSKRFKCYRSHHNRCQLLTQCQLRRINCIRGAHNHLEWDNPSRCNGMKPGQSLQKCGSFPKAD